MPSVAPRAAVVLFAFASVSVLPASADDRSPPTTQGTEVGAEADVTVTPQAMLESLPRQLVPNDGKDHAQIASAAKWLTQNFVGHHVTFSGAGEMTVEIMGGDASVVVLSVHSFRAMRWAETFVTCSFDGRTTVTDAVAKRLHKRDREVAATVRLTLESVEFHGDDAKHLRMLIKGKMIAYTLR